MGRVKKCESTKALNMLVDAKIFDMLTQFCSEQGTTKTTTVERVMRAFLEDYFKKPAKDRMVFR